MASSEAAIWGYGREGQAAFDHLRKTRPDLTLVILNDTPLADAPDDVEVMTGDAAQQALQAGRFALVVKSPGISLYRPEITEAKTKGTRFTSGTNLWFEAHPDARTIAVTGTKGKSTVSRLIHHLLVKGGFDAKLLGNVGVAAHQHGGAVLLGDRGEDLGVFHAIAPAGLEILDAVGRRAVHDARAVAFAHILRQFDGRQTCKT